MRRIWGAFSTTIITILLIVSYYWFTPIKAEITLLRNNEVNWEVLENKVNSEQELFILSQNNQDQESPNNQEQENSTKDKPDTSESEQEEFPVTLDGESIFYYRTGIKDISSKKRAEIAERRLQRFADDFSLSVDSLEIIELEGLRIISSEDNMMVALIKSDAEVADLSLDDLAEEYLKKVKDAVTNYRQKRGKSYLVLGLIKAIITTLIVIIIFKFIKYLTPKINGLIISWRSFIFHSIRVQNLQIITAEQEEKLFFKFLRLFRWIIRLTILYFYIPLVLSFFPWTEDLGEDIFDSFYQAINTVWSNFIDYLPNLSLIIVTAVITYYTVRLCRPFFNAIKDGNLTIPGFYQEWAEPTFKLTKFLILAFAAAIIFPYLPGFDSPAFQGISILIGALVTFGGASTIANLIGGFIIIYTRSFQIGDRIKIDQYIGWVLERTILSTRIRTNNNEIVTIPNATMIASSIVNYTATLRDIGNPLIINTTITLGYDVPWRKVYEALIKAALATDRILDDPPPFVWQTSLNDFYISYQLRAYSNATTELGYIYSQLHENIQDQCNEAGIEILSPHYGALRDGNQNTIPEDYLPKDYTAPGFRIDPLKQIFGNHQNS